MARSVIESRQITQVSRSREARAGRLEGGVVEGVGAVDGVGAAFNVVGWRVATWSVLIL